MMVSPAWCFLAWWDDVYMCVCVWYYDKSALLLCVVCVWRFFLFFSSPLGFWICYPKCKCCVYLNSFISNNLLISLFTVYFHHSTKISAPLSTPKYAKVSSSGSSSVYFSVSSSSRSRIASVLVPNFMPNNFSHVVFTRATVTLFGKV